MSEKSDMFDFDFLLHNVLYILEALVDAAAHSAHGILI
jgi:hypothetical protein